MALKQCKYCGKPFVPSGQAQAVCEDCLAAARSTTIRPRTCRACGTTFDGGPRAWYCPSCRAERQKEASRRARKEGTKRPLGSIDHCVICGKEYIVNSARQRYCPDCAPEAYAAADREASKAWNAANDYYAKRAQSPRSGIRLCVICGKPLPLGSNAVTCSPECQRKNLALSRQKIEANRGKRKLPISIRRLDTPEMLAPEEGERPKAKVCCICGVEFLPNSGSQKYCKNCASKRAVEWQKEYYALHREKILAAQKERSHQRKDTGAPKEAVPAVRACCICGAEFSPVNWKQKYCKDCAVNQARESRKRYSKKYYSQNREKILAAAKESRKRYYAKNKERIKAQRKAKKEQKKKGNTPGGIT